MRAGSTEQRNAIALREVLEHGADELLWVAEVMTGSKPAGAQCVAEAIQLSEEAEYVKPEWMLCWLKRMLVHAALKRVGREIRELLPADEPRRGAALMSGSATASDRQRLRSIPSQMLVGSIDVLERACLILHVYLGYPLLDCALLLGCQRGRVESISERVLAKAAVIGQPSQEKVWSVDFSIAPQVTECAS